MQSLEHFTLSVSAQLHASAASHTACIACGRYLLAQAGPLQQSVRGLCPCLGSSLGLGLRFSVYVFGLGLRGAIVRKIYVTGPSGWDMQ